MSISKGNVSQSAVLSDLDLGAGSFRQRAVLNRAGKTGGNMSLSDHRGVACATQLNNFSITDAVPNNTNTGFGSFYPTRAGTGYVSGNQIVLTAGYSGSGGPDGTSGHNTNFKVTENGSYRITGTIDWTAENTYSLTYWQIALVSSSRGYLSGVTTNDLFYEGDQYGSSGIKTFNRTANLTTARRFITMVFYAVRKSGGDVSLPQSVAKFYDFKVVKV